MPQDNYHYGQNHLYTIASQLSRVVEQENPADSITVGIANGLKQLYDNGLCNSDVTQALMVKAWKLVLLRELADDSEVKEIGEYVDLLARDFVDSIDKLGIQTILKEKLGY